MGAIHGGLGTLAPGRKVWGSVRYWTWLQLAPFPHMVATALRSRHVLQGQMYDGRLTKNTACNILFNVSYILCFSKYTYR